MNTRSNRRRSVGLHQDMGRRYEHSDLTARARRSRSTRRKSMLLHQALKAVEARYAQELDKVLFEALHGAVVRVLRPELDARWSREEAETHALQIAAQLLEDSIPDDM